MKLSIKRQVQRGGLFACSPLAGLTGVLLYRTIVCSLVVVRLVKLLQLDVFSMRARAGWTRRQ